MQLTLDVILIALAALLFNVLDSVTTKLALSQYPDKELKGEGNPLMRRLMLKSGLLAEVLKQVGVLALVLWCLTSNDIQPLRFFAIMLGLVVLNNTYVVVSRAIAKRKVITPIEKLRRILHLPDKYTFIMAIVIISVLATIIDGLLWA